MKLNLIYGKSGSGKSSYIYENIKKNLEDNKIFLIVPEQSNLSAEKKLFEVLEKETLINVEVLTLKRMAYRVINEIGKENKLLLSKVGKNLLIYDLLNKQKSKLNFLSKNNNNVELIAKTITEFKKHNIFPETLENTIVEDEYTHLKVQDMYILYKGYQEKISKNYIDENDDLSILSDNLDKVDIFKNTLIYIDEFMGFTPQEIKVFEKLIMQARKVTVSICANNLEIKNKENDIFYFNKKFAKKLIEIANEKTIETNLINIDEVKKFKTLEMKLLEENFSNSKISSLKENPKNVELFLADNPSSELEYVANQILNLVKDGYRYNQIAILTSNLEKYDIDAKIIFEKYNIPMYIDVKKQLTQNILVRYLISILDVFSNNWSIDSVINYLKTGLVDVSRDDIYNFENYCNKWGITRKKFFNEFIYEEVNDKQEKIEETRRIIINPLISLIEKINQNKNVKTITTNIYNFIIENNILDRLNEKLKYINNIEIINEYNTSYRLLIELFEQIIDLFGEEKISFEKYKELLQVGLSSTQVGTIPATQDQVIIGQMDRARFSDIKVCFILGANDGEFPIRLSTEGYFNDKDRQILALSGIEMAKNSIDTLYEDEFNVYKTLTIPEEKLIISYSSSDCLGANLRPSTLLKKIKRIFPNIEQKSDIINKNIDITNKVATFEEALKQYYMLINGFEISDKWKQIIKYYQIKEKEKFDNAILAINFTNKSEKITDENLKKLYGNNLKASISKLEEYKKCPFSYHIKYGLNLKEKKEFKIQTIDTGNFMHEIIDEFFAYLDEKNLKVNLLEEEYINEIVEEILSRVLGISKYYILSSNAKFRSLTRKLKKVILESIKYIVYTLKNSKFEVLEHEAEFGKGKKYPAIIIDNENNTTTELTGKIDRIDIGKIDGKEYLRIIDYKSSIKNIDMNKVINGLQIQLITYIESMNRIKKTNSAGILYMNLIDNIVKSSKNKTEEEIKEEIKKNFRMQGIVVANVDILKNMDTTLDNGSSDIIPVTLKKDGSISESKSSTITEEEFELLQKQVIKIIKQISKEILKGKIDIKPFKYKQSTGCDFCKFRSICMFDNNDKKCEYNYIKEENKEEILYKMKCSE